MLLDVIKQRCVQSGAEELVRVWPTGERLGGTAFLAEVEALRDQLGALGLGKADRIGLSLPIGPDLLVAIVATWSLGASFVPVDPREATRRLESIIEESRLGAVLTSHRRPDIAAAGTLALVLSHGQIVAADGELPSQRAGRPAEEAYVIFTSGSTGAPKGVSVGHASITAYLDTIRDLYRVPDQGLLIPSQLPPTFDAALTTLLLPLVTGNTSVLIQNPSAATSALASMLADVDEPVLIKTTPSQLRVLGTMLSDTDISRLADRGATIIVGGEALDFADTARLHHPGITVFNEYGPTETTVGCSAHRLELGSPPTGPVPIGRPFPGTTFRLDRSDDHPAGEGEIVIAGPGVALGYLGDATAGRFGTDDRGRIYRSGDLARIDSDGRYHFLGRRDDQVKVNGYRVELGEVDAALRVACGGPAVAVFSSGMIVAVAEHRLDLDLATAAARMQALLPAHMQPTAFRVVSELPLTSHGKVDRAQAFRQSAPLDGMRRADDFGTRIAEQWQSMLNLVEVDDDTNFFEAGAHSITALTMVGHVAADLQADVPFSLIFDHPRFADFVTAVRAIANDDNPGQLAPLSGAARDTTRTPSATQLALLGAESWAVDPAEFTVVTAARVAVPDWRALERAVAATLKRHDVLGWRFSLDDRYQITAAAVGADTVPVESVDLRNLSPEDASGRITATLNECRRRPINLLAGDPPARMVLTRTRGTDGRDHGVIALIAHHAVVDEPSVALLWSEVISRLRGEHPTPDPDQRYRRWAEASVLPESRRAARDLAADLVKELAAGPLGHLDTAVAAEKEGVRRLETAFSADLSGRVAEAARRLQLPTTALAGAAAASALAGSMTEHRFPVFLPVTRRRSPDEFATVGCFLAAVPIAVQPPAPEHISAGWLHAWRRTLVDAITFAAADGAEVGPLLQRSSPEWATAPRVALMIETPFTVERPDLSWVALPAPPSPPKYDLTVFVTVTGGRPAGGRIEWRAGAFDADRGRALLDALNSALQHIVGITLDASAAGSPVRQAAGQVPTGQFPDDDTEQSPTRTIPTS
ncbi:AMP-binding protein [Micromonospora sp. WMMA1976]|uniref:AMP-binding protein n=1 Tax=Micromonospora sp. WMMA1976 TaxID=3014995 RepID=UPI00248CF053|nr:AMP-binding protein [Micromonospora sp. WMMA1976]WBC01103.1 AMP-binding protein [Micromonospora sp. WMMA1976]